MLVIHVMLKYEFHYVPESVAVILIGKSIDNSHTQTNFKSCYSQVHLLG